MMSERANLLANAWADESDGVLLVDCTHIYRDGYVGVFSTNASDPLEARRHDALADLFRRINPELEVGRSHDGSVSVYVMPYEMGDGAVSDLPSCGLAAIVPHYVDHRDKQHGTIADVMRLSQWRVLP